MALKSLWFPSVNRSHQFAIKVRFNLIQSFDPTAAFRFYSQGNCSVLPRRRYRNVIYKPDMKEKKETLSKWSLASTAQNSYAEMYVGVCKKRETRDITYRKSISTSAALYRIYRLLLRVNSSSISHCPTYSYSRMWDQRKYCVLPEWAQGESVSSWRTSGRLWLTSLFDHYTNLLLISWNWPYSKCANPRNKHKWINFENKNPQLHAMRYVAYTTR